MPTGPTAIRFADLGLTHEISELRGEAARCVNFDDTYDAAPNPSLPPHPAP